MGGVSAARHFNIRSTEQEQDVAQASSEKAPRNMTIDGGFADVLEPWSLVPQRERQW